MSKNWKEFIGKKFNRWTILDTIRKPIGKQRNTEAYFICRCDCGTEKEVEAKALLSSRSKSCGCYQKDNPTIVKHRQCDTRLYRIWANMKNRCHNEQSNGYKYWGGRGISVCDEWRTSFESFRDWALLNGYSDELTIDRIDNDGNYEPDNCRWATMLTQIRNKRYKENKLNVKGVYRRGNKYRAYIGVDYKTISLGSFDTLLEASEARKQAEAKYFSKDIA